VVIKFIENRTLEIVDNEAALINYNGSGVYFTSYKDDSLKGDSNGDNETTLPAPADWVGIYIYGMGIKTQGYANWENIKYNDPNPPVK